MNNNKTVNELLNKLNTFLTLKQLFYKKNTNCKQIAKTSDILEMLNVNKNILESLYIWEYAKSKKNLVNFFKSFFKKIIKNIVINTIERTISKQSKFNSLTYTAIELLVEENIQLRKEIEEIKKQIDENQHKY